MLRARSTPLFRQMSVMQTTPSMAVNSRAFATKVEDGFPEIVTGAEKAELEANLPGDDFWGMGPSSETKWGTADDPVSVPSHYDSRLVGCAGDGCKAIDGDHEIVWWELKKGDAQSCICGQYFKLTKPAGGHH